MLPKILMNNNINNFSSSLVVVNIIYREKAENKKDHEEPQDNRPKPY